MYQLELVFRLLVRLQFMYFQYNVYLSIVVRTNIYKYNNIYNIHVILGHPNWRASPASWGVKSTHYTKCLTTIIILFPIKLKGLLMKTY